MTVTRASRPVPEVHTVAARIVRLLNEVEAGRRPARQVSPLFAPHLRGAIRRVRPDPGPVPDVHRLVITAATAAHTYEIVAVCRRNDRYGAIGLRLSRTDDGWVVTDVAHPRFTTNGSREVSDPTGPGDPGTPRRG